MRYHIADHNRLLLQHTYSVVHFFTNSKFQFPRATDYYNDGNRRCYSNAIQAYIAEWSVIRALETRLTLLTIVSIM